MDTFEIEIKETLSMVIKVEAENQCEAVLKVRGMYQNQEIILDSEDYNSTDITPFINSSYIQEIIDNYSDSDERIVLKKFYATLEFLQTNQV